MKMTLVQVRKKAMLTQKEVASIIGVTPATISNWENRISAVNIPQFINLCSLYCCTVDDIFIPRG